MRLYEQLRASWPMTEGEGPCRTWPLAPDCGCLELPVPAPGTALDPDTLDVDVRFAVECASWLLWTQTAGRYGLCEQTVRPCLPPGAPPMTCGCPPTLRCGCVGAEQLLLPGTVRWEDPMGDEPALVTVWLDGQALNRDQWRIAPPNRLLRLDGTPWPTRQALRLPLTAEGTFGVSYWTGEPVPPLGRRAAAVLACEMWKACQGDSSCALPSHWVERLDREGVSYTMFDPLELIHKGRTGIPEVDTFLAAANPGRHRGPSLVWSPDLPTFELDRRPGPAWPADYGGAG